MTLMASGQSCAAGAARDVEDCKKLWRVSSQSGELGIDESKVIIERRQGQFFGVGDALG
jgi:hypothetical protein